MGKTTTAYLVAKEMGFDVMELNASDTRSKKQLDAIVTDAVSSQSLSKVSTKRVKLFKAWIICPIEMKASFVLFSSFRAENLRSLQDLNSDHQRMHRE